MIGEERGKEKSIVRRTFYSILTVLLSTFVTLSLAETILQILDYPEPTISGWKTTWPYKSEKHQLGFRGQPIHYSDDDYVIVLLGDSQVEARACAFEWMPERRLEFYLNSAGKKVKVFSLGGWGTGTDQQLLSLKEYYQSFRADMVILWFTPMNDVWNNMFPSNMPDDRTPKPTFWIKDDQLFGPTEMTGQPARETSSLRLVRLWRKIFPWPREKEWAQFLLAPYLPMNEKNGPTRDDWQMRLDSRPDVPWENFNTDKHDKILYLTPRSPRTQYGLDLTRKLLQEVKKLVMSQDGRFAMFWVRPGNSEKNEETEPGEVVHALNGKYYKSSDTQLNENMDYISHGFNRFVIPLTVTPWRVAPDDEHLNEHATDQIIKDLATEVVNAIPSRH